MEKYYPAFLNIAGKLCVVVGGGAVAVRKVDALLDCGAVVRVVSPKLLPKLQALARTGRLEHLPREYSEDVLAGAFLVIAAASPAEVNRRVAIHCAEKGIPVNVVDAPHLGSFIVPAKIARGPLTLAISTGGAAPALARRLCRQLEEVFDETYGVWLEELAAARARVLTEVADQKRRKAILTALSDEKLLSLLRREGRESLQKSIDQIIGGY